MGALWTMTAFGALLVMARTAISLSYFHKIAVADVLAAISSVRQTGSFSKVGDSNY